jgi:hypothetical protein
MGLFHHNSNVSAEKLASEVRLYAVDDQLHFPNDRYDTRVEKLDPDYPERRLFQLDKGVKGKTSYIPGERMGFIDVGRKIKKEEAHPIARVTLLKKSGFLAIGENRVTANIDASEMLPEVLTEAQAGTEMTLELFCKQAIAQAVLKTANGRQENN